MKTRNVMIKIFLNFVLFFVSAVLFVLATPAAFAAAKAEGETVKVRQGEKVSLTFTYENVRSLDGTIEYTDSTIFSGFAATYSGSNFNGGVTKDKVYLYRSDRGAANVTITLTLTVNAETAVGTLGTVTLNLDGYDENYQALTLEAQSKTVEVTPALDLTALNSLKSTATKKLANKNYTQESLNVLKTALNNAVVTDTTTQEDVDGYCEALQAAIDGLTYLNYDALNAAIESANALYESSEETRNWKNLADALQAAKNSLKGGTSQAAVDEATAQLVEAIEAVEQALADQKAEIDSLKKTIAEKTAEIERLENSIKVLQEEAEKNLREAQEKIDALTAQVTELNNQIGTLNDTIADLNKKITDLNKKITDLNSQITQKNTTIDELTARIAELERQLENSGSKEEIERLKAEIETLKGEKATLQSEKETLQADKATLESEKATLQSQLTAANTALEEAQTEKANLETQLTTANTAKEKAEADLAEANTQIGTLTAEKEKAEADLTAAQARVSEIEEELKAAAEKNKALQDEIDRANAAKTVCIIGMIICGVVVIAGVVFLLMKRSKDNSGYHIEPPTVDYDIEDDDYMDDDEDEAPKARKPKHIRSNDTDEY